jgi:hypothetical protein
MSTPDTAEKLSDDSIRRINELNSLLENTTNLLALTTALNADQRRRGHLITIA